MSWAELVDMFVHCFPAVSEHVRNGETLWEVGQHCVHDNCGKRYHYWATDTAYPHQSRYGMRRRRDMVHVKGLTGVHLAEIVCFVRVTLPPPPGAVTTTRPQVRYTCA